MEIGRKMKRNWAEANSPSGMPDELSPGSRLKTNDCSSAQEEDSIVRRKTRQRLLRKWALALVLLAGPEVARAKGLVGKLPGNPASCPEEPCGSDPQHVLRALKHTSYFVGVIFLMPVLLYYISKLFSKVRDCFAGAARKPRDKADLAQMKKQRKSKESSGSESASGGAQKQEAQQQVFVTRNSAQSERHKSASVVTTSSSHSRGAPVRQSLELSVGKPEAEEGRLEQAGGTPAQPGAAERPGAQRNSIMGPANLTHYHHSGPGGGSKSGSPHLAELGELGAGARYNLAQHRYSMFNGTPAPPAHTELGPGFGSSSKQQEIWLQKQQQQNNFNDEQAADLKRASSLRRSSLRRQRQVNSPLTSASPDLTNEGAYARPRTGSRASSKRHKVFPVDGAMVEAPGDELHGGRPDSAGAREQRPKSTNGLASKSARAAHELERNVNERRGAAQGPEWTGGKEAAASWLEVPHELGPQHRHSIDGSILNNMLLVAAEQEPAECDGGPLGDVTLENIESAPGGQRATKRREQLHLFQAHQRQLAQLHQLQVSSIPNEAEPAAGPARQKQQRRSARRQLLDAPGANNNAAGQRQQQLILMPHPAARERRPSLNAAAFRPAAGQRQHYA